MPHYILTICSTFINEAICNINQINITIGKSLHQCDGAFYFVLKTASNSHTNKKDWFTGDQVSLEH